MPIKRAFRTVVGGLWGEEAEGTSQDVRCVRVADFDYTRLGVSSRNVTFRSIPQHHLINRLLAPGDLVIEKSGGGETAPVGRAVLWTESTRAVTSNFMARLQPAAGFSGRYLTYVLAHLYSCGANRRYIKQTTGIQNLDLSAYLEERWNFPIPETQQVIADFLDRETARIEELMYEQVRLLEDLGLKRRATIAHAVTQGLQGGRPLWDAGTPWLRTLPEAWAAEPLKKLVRLQGGHTPPDEPHFWNGGVPWVSPKDMKVSIIQATEDTVTEAATHDGHLNLYPLGSVLMVVRSGILRHKIPVAVNAVPVTVNQDMKVLRSQGRLLPQFLYYFFEGLGPTLLPVLQKVGATVESINMAALRALMIPVPPIEEQQEIAEHLGTQLAQIDELVEEVHASMDLMRQHRSALITAAVTGKIDVRPHL